MKKNHTLIGLFGIIFFLAACTWAGGTTKNYVSDIKNSNGYLFKKAATDFDGKFGYETFIYKEKDSGKIITLSVFIPKQIWEKIPPPSDTLRIEIEYLEDIEYGESSVPIPSLWDKQFNLCINVKVDTLIKKDTLSKASY